MSKKIRKLILTPESQSTIKIECGPMRTDLSKLISTVKKRRKIIYFSRQFIVERGEGEQNRKARYAHMRRVALVGLCI